MKKITTIASAGRHFVIALFRPSLLVLFLLAGQGCSKQVGQWDVFKGKTKVLWIKEEPGVLISTGMLPAGAEPVRHPFLTGVAKVPEEEDHLGRLLRSAKTFDEFVLLLKRDGYTLKPSSEQRKPNKSIQGPP